MGYFILSLLNFIIEAFICLQIQVAVKGGVSSQLDLTPCFYLHGWSGGGSLVIRFWGSSYIVGLS